MVQCSSNRYMKKNRWHTTHGTDDENLHKLFHCTLSTKSRVTYDTTTLHLPALFRWVSIQKNECSFFGSEKNNNNEMMK